MPLKMPMLPQATRVSRSFFQPGRDYAFGSYFLRDDKPPGELAPPVPAPRNIKNFYRTTGRRVRSLRAQPMAIIS